jgi:sugar lactone lactonase YvrE
LVVTESDLQAVVRLEPQSGMRTIVSDATVGGGPPLRFPQGIVVEATGQLLLLDQFPTALVRIDPQSGARQVVVDETTTNSEVALRDPRSIALTATGHIVVLDVFPTEGPGEGFPPLIQGRVLQLDLISGLRTVISDTLIGRGPLLEFPQDIAVEAQGTFVVLGAVAAGMGAGRQVIGWRVIRVNPADGARTLLTEEIVTSNVPSLAPQGIAVEDNGNLVVVDHVSREGNLRGWRVVRIHPESGMRTVLADTTLGDRFPAVLPSDIAVEPNGQLVVADRILGNFGTRGGHVVRIAPDSGARTVVSSEGIGNGPLLRFPGHIALEPDGHLIVADESSPAIIRVDPVTGERTMVSDNMTGGGAALRDMLQGIAVETSGQLVIVDEFFPAIVRVTPDTGVRTIISDEHTGSGPTFLSLQDIAVEATGHLVVIDEFLKAILRVDPLTGVRSIVSDEQHGSGPLFGSFLRSVAVEASGHLVVVDGTVTNGRPIIRIHPLTGSRTIVSDASVGSGPSLAVPRGIAIEMTGELLVVDRVLRAVVRIDPISGDRRILSDDAIGVGPVFSDPVDITVESTGQIIVLDMGLRAIIRVDAQHGDRAIISR